MINNLHVIDRILRVVIAILILAFYWMGQLTGTAGVVLGIVAIIFIITGLIGYCPLYHLLGISTKGK